MELDQLWVMKNAVGKAARRTKLQMERNVSTTSIPKGQPQIARFNTVWKSLPFRRAGRIRLHDTHWRVMTQPVAARGDTPQDIPIWRKCLVDAAALRLRLNCGQ